MVAPVSAPIEGTLEAVEVEVGAEVSEGQLLARIKNLGLEAAQAEGLKAALKQRFGRDIELHSEIDTRLIGGAVIDAGDVVIDGSVRGRLARLERALSQ